MSPNVEDADLAIVSPCPNCGKPVRRFSSTPIAGSGLDRIFSGPWWCDECLQKKTDAAVADVDEAGPDS